MQRMLQKLRRSDEEAVKDQGLILDFDEIARKGSMSKEETSVAKWYGIYHSRQAGAHMARVVVPGGVLTSVEARELARLSTIYSPGCISVTTRQSMQFHWLKLKELPQFLRDIQAAGMTTFHGCGDVNRNTAACPWAGICKHRVLNVLPYADETAKYLAECRDLDNLPRKFKVTYSGCEGGCGQPYMNCVGVIAVKHPGKGPGFRVNIGGGLGWRAFAAQQLYAWVPPAKIHRLNRAIALLFRDHGDRYIRMYARLKFVVHRYGIDKCREIVEENLKAEGVDTSDFIVASFDNAAEPVPHRPLRDTAPIGTDGLGIERIMVPKGELSSEHLARIAELSEIYGDKHVYTTNRQNLEIHGVKPERVAELRGEIQKLGFQTEGFFGLQDVVTCVGTTYCPLAVSATHSMFDDLQAIVHDPKYAPIRDKIVVNISGCPNSCGQYHVADIGMRGLRVREGVGSVEGYRVTLGGCEPVYGTIMGNYKHDDCLAITRAVLDYFLENGNGEETLAQHFARVGVEPYRALIDGLGIEYVMADNPLELSTFTGEGEADMDLETQARDVPCQAACPAHTNVPEYIGHIARGEHDKAHLINQEDNVFPGILGRICTRPCEDRCRYQWTSTRGPVQICHLKRAAADGKPGKSEPLPAWFEASGKKVAVIGGGPAGLAAARELKRYGHEVALFERMGYLGGQITAGIPEFRLPREIINEDIDAIVNSGIDVHLNTDVNAAKMQELVDAYDAVLVTVGTNKPYTISLDGLEDGMAVEGLNFMKRYNDGDPLPIEGDVVVIGGGFTAVDCSRSARRILGDAANVSIMYRRGEAQMSATPEELEAIREEDIRIETLVTPVSARVEGGKLRGVTFQRNLLGEPDESGKPKFTPIEDNEFEVPCDTLVLAIGQTQEDYMTPQSVEFAYGEHTSNTPGIFAAGDFVSGSGDVIHAAADGKDAAGKLDAWLMDGPRRKTHVNIEKAPLTGRTRDHDLIYPPAMPVLPLEERGGNGEVELGFNAEDADAHAWRCYLCNHKFEIDQDKCIHCDWCIRVSPRDCILRLQTLERDEDGQPTSYVEVAKEEPQDATFIWIKSDNCIRCGNCINICPVDAISLRKTDRVTVNCNGK